MMEDVALTVAKEITIAIAPRMELGANKSAEMVGENAGKLFKIVLKHVVEGINENKSEPKKPATTRSAR